MNFNSVQLSMEIGLRLAKVKQGKTYNVMQNDYAIQNIFNIWSFKISIIHICANMELNLQNEYSMRHLSCYLLLQVRCLCVAMWTDNFCSMSDCVHIPFQQENSSPKRKDRTTPDGMQLQQFQSNVGQNATFIVWSNCSLWLFTSNLCKSST